MVKRKAKKLTRTKTTKTIKKKVNTKRVRRRVPDNPFEIDRVPTLI